MSKVIEGVPEFLSYDQYLGIFSACGVAPTQVVEMRLAYDGVHVIVFALGEDGGRIVDMHATPPAYQKHRIFIPVRRDPQDERVTRTSKVGAK